MMSNFWKDKKVLIPGGTGFVGQHLVSLLWEQHCYPIVPRQADYDLRYAVAAQRLFDYIGKPIDILINLAANVGGIGYNQNHPYELLYDNLQLGLNLIDESIRHKVKKFVQIGTVCAYPKWAKPPFNEKTLWDGYPEETNAPYGLAKKMLLIQLQTARDEYGFNGIYLLPTNLYGPGDTFEPERSHVIPALIRKFIDAREVGWSTVDVWGTGNASREFLYVKDCAEAILLAAEHYNNQFPINLGSGQETRIAWLVYHLAEMCDYHGSIRWDTNKPDGQPRRSLDISQAKHAFNFEAKTSLIEGLKETIAWYEAERLKAKTPVLKSDKMQVKL
jgi:GDP-L-fucose synthase